MKLTKISISWKYIFKIFLTSVGFVLFLLVLLGTYTLGFIKGYVKGGNEFDYSLISLLNTKPITKFQAPEPTTVPIPSPKPTQKIVKKQISWGGPELWAAVNKKRQELGVNPLSQRDELCTIASIRLNELLELGKLDGHEGFSSMKDKRLDLTWIFDKYSTIAEFLAMGGNSPEETVALWENTLGHKKLLDGGEYVWGCIYAQDTFAVAIAAY